MASHPHKRPSLVSILTTLALLLSSCMSFGAQKVLRIATADDFTVLAGFYASVAQSTTYKQADWPFRRILIVHVIQRFMPRFVPKRYCHDLIPTTGSTIRSACNKAKLALTSTILPGEQCPDATIHEINLPDKVHNAPVLLYFHGGGYRISLASTAQVAFVRSLAEKMGASSLFILEYTLTPHGQYPCQLRQAVLAVRYLLTKGGYSPDQIGLAGDSAGGNLIFSLLAHLIKPHPLISPVQEMEGKSLRLAVCISPWVSLDYTTESFKVYDKIDALDAEGMIQFTELWKPENEVWADMLLGDSVFWAKVPVRRIMITAGSIECLKDGIESLHDLLGDAKRNGVDVHYVMAEHEIHAQPALDVASKLPPCGSMKAILSFLEKT